jgi:uncharacterized integral membrane protein (TIGR00698 family)
LNSLISPYLLFFLIAMTPWVSSAVALIMGLVLSLGFCLPLPAQYKKVSKYLLQASIVFLGFSMDPQAVWRAGIDGVGVTAASLALTLGAGYWLAKRFGIVGKVATLITVGTAICGGSAIAAVSPIIEADSDEMSVSLAVVFLLNGIALLLFPLLGHALGFTPTAFGYLSAVAIHDTSSVVGAATKFNELSVPVAVTIKLTRALWIVPITLLFAYVEGKRRAGQAGIKKAKATVPLFIPLFIGAVIFRAIFPGLLPAYHALGMAGKAGLNGAIFLISSQMSRAALKRVGTKPLMLAVSLWAIVIAATVTAIHYRILG